MAPPASGVSCAWNVARHDCACLQVNTDIRRTLTCSDKACMEQIAATGMQNEENAELYLNIVENVLGTPVIHMYTTAMGHVTK